MELVDQGKFPSNAEAAETLSFGDVEKGFAEADLIVERDMHQQTTSHQPLESRSAMAYWQNGKCYLHVSTQSAGAHVASVAGWVGVKPDELVLISEYTGGGFGSKIPGAQTMAIPALMSKKLNGRPVMMRISRAEETYIGRVRPGYQGWIKMGFKKDGRVTAIDTFIVEASGPYRRQGDHATTANIGSLLFQAPNMRFRGISVATNTPPGVSQRAPGGLQASVWFEPLMHEASQKLGIDQVAIHKMNAPEGQPLFGLVPPNTPPGRPRNKLTSCFVKECLDKGAEMFNWEARKANGGGKRTGSKVRGVGVGIGAYTAGSIGVDGLCILRPDGKLEIHQGVGNLGTLSTFDTARVICEVSGFPWEQSEVVWGNTSKGLPWSSIQAGSQTTYAHTRANYATGMDLKKKLTEIAAKDFGGNPASYDTNDRGVIRKGGGVVLTWAKAAERAIKLGGDLRRHRDAEGDQRDDQGRGGRAQGPRADGRGARQPAARRPDLRLHGGIRRSRGRRRDGRVDDRRFRRRRRRRHGDSPAQPGRADSRRRHPGHRPRAQPEAGLRPALRQRACRRACTTTSRRRSSTSRRRRSGRPSDCRTRPIRSVPRASASRRRWPRPARC